MEWLDDGKSSLTYSYSFAISPNVYYQGYEHYLLTLAPILGQTYISNIFGVFRNEYGQPVVLTPYYRNGNVHDYNSRVPDADKLKQVSDGDTFNFRQMIYSFH